MSRTNKIPARRSSLPRRRSSERAAVDGPARPDPELRAVLDRFLAASDPHALARADPVELVRGYVDPHDQEVAGLIVAALAYGRVASIKAKATRVLEALGASPAEAVASGEAARSLRGFVYRFQRGLDVPRFLSAIGAVRADEGSLAAAFAAEIDPAEPDYAPALDRFVLRLRGQMRGPLTRGLQFLLPRASGETGAAKRLFLYLRWMIRPAGPADLGSWQALVPGRLDPAKLIIPLDTHIERIGRYIGLTDRKSSGLPTAREITETLRRLRPADPLAYDMALCHLGIAGACPRKREVAACAACPIRELCRLGPEPDGWSEVTRRTV